MEEQERKEGTEEQGAERSEYTPPKIRTYTSQEILDQIGPAQACSPGPCGMIN
jgi:hypothetical protein